MFLYKIEIQLEDQLIYLVSLAESDEKALQAVDAHVEKHFIKPQVMKEIALIEKKRVVNGTGYVLETKVD
ncbi:MAG: hypothetical protein RLZZ267_1156 [Bacillota bacterium]|jgi:hypothetical protein